MIDIHTHILPGLDDGAKDPESSLKIAGIALKNGTTAMVATPHTLNGIYLNRRKDILSALNRLKEQLKVAGIPLAVYPGAEAPLTPEVVRSLASGELMTINDGGKYIMTELPAYFIREDTFKTVFALKTKGITPVISHPERDVNVKKDPNLLVELINRGCLLQITARSITGGFGKKIMEFSHLLLQRGLIQIISSDCHSDNRRGPDLHTGVREAANIIGAELAGKMALDFPKSIIEGKEIDLPPYRPISDKRKFWFWKRA